LRVLQKKSIAAVRSSRAEKKTHARKTSISSQIATGWQIRKTAGPSTHQEMISDARARRAHSKGPLSDEFFWPLPASVVGDLSVRGTGHSISR
jgi:hypothetical protein